MRTISLIALLLILANAAHAGEATLRWIAPTQNTDGSPLTNLAGYRIYYGTSSTQLTQTIQLANAGLTTYVVRDLAPGTWYFAVTAYNSAGVESALSNIVSKVVRFPGPTDGAIEDPIGD